MLLTTKVHVNAFARASKAATEAIGQHCLTYRMSNDFFETILDTRVIELHMGSKAGSIPGDQFLIAIDEHGV